MCYAQKTHRGKYRNPTQFTVVEIPAERTVSEDSQAIRQQISRNRVPKKNQSTDL